MTTLNNPRAYLVLIDSNKATCSEIHNFELSLNPMSYAKINGELLNYTECNSLKKLKEKYNLKDISISDVDIIRLLKEDEFF